VPRGTYLCGTVFLLGNVTLELRRGATLLASPDLGDYRSVGRSTEGRSSALIIAEGRENVGIVGEGTIDGNGRSFVFQPRQPHPAGFFDAAATRQGSAFFQRNQEDRDGPDRMRNRPGILALFLECRNVTLRGFTVVDAPNWCLHLACCRHAELSGLTVRNSLRIPNADAIDLASSRDVRVSGCTLEAGDDGIAISPCADGYRSAVAQDITVSRCVITSRSAGIRLGWAARDIRRVRFDHIAIRGSNRGIGIFVRGRESIEDVSFSDVTIDTHLVDGAWWGLGEPVHISVAPYLSGGPLGRVRGIRFKDVTSVGEGPVVLYSSGPGGISDVTFERCSLAVRRSPLDAYYGGNLDLRPILPAALGITGRGLSAVLAVNVDALRMRGLSVSWLGGPSPYFAAALEADGCRGADLGGFEGRGPRPGAPAIVEDGLARAP
jgi:polygalacturonase